MTDNPDQRPRTELGHLTRGELFRAMVAVVLERYGDSSVDIDKAARRIALTLEDEPHVIVEALALARHEERHDIEAVFRGALDYVKADNPDPDGTIEAARFADIFFDRVIPADLPVTILASTADDLEALHARMTPALGAELHHHTVINFATWHPANLLREAAHHATSDAGRRLLNEAALHANIFGLGLGET